MFSIVNRINTRIVKCKNVEKYKLLKNYSVIQWLYGDHSFLMNHTYKDESDWGNKLLISYYPNRCRQSWSHVIGEEVCKEIYMLRGQIIRPSERRCKYLPDLETDDAVIEVKTQCYYNTGSISEKILGVSFKYIDVPVIYNKPLYIVCIGGAEKISREKYGILGVKMASERKNELLKYYKERGIEYRGATELLDEV
jgi:hypothetical protein